MLASALLGGNNVTHPSNTLPYTTYLEFVDYPVGHYRTVLQTPEFEVLGDVQAFPDGDTWVIKIKARKGVVVEVVEE